MSNFRELLTRRDPGIAVRFARALLWLVSWPYGAAMWMRNRAYDLGWCATHRSRLPVISVGNLSVGGTGKSPVVTWLARRLRQRQQRVAILSRGYGQLAAGQNDEASEMALLLPDVPHLQHWDRIASATLADEELDMQVLVLDDGFQHRRLARDLDLVLIDASDPPASRRLLPAGLLREPMTSLSRAHVIVLTRVDQARQDELAALRQTVNRSAPQALTVEASHRPTGLVGFPFHQQDLGQLRGKSVLAFCGIGNPQSFWAVVRELGANILEQRVWPDHHAYTAEDIQDLRGWCQRQPAAQIVLCTMKDWVKLQIADLGGCTLLAVQIELHIERGQDELEQKLDALKVPDELETGAP